MSDTLSTGRSTLLAKQTDLTQRLILDAAVALLLESSVTDLSVRAVAKRAEMSERTVFRYFASRDELLDALAQDVSRRLHAPDPPGTIAELLAFPAALYAQFEQNAALIQAALHTDLFHRIRSSAAERRHAAIRALLDRAAPTRSDRERRLTAANIQFHVVASTWRYYRSYFGLSAEDAVAAARMAIAQALAGLGLGVVEEA